MPQCFITICFYWIFLYDSARARVCVHVRARVCVEYTTRLLSPRTNSSLLSFHYSLSSPASFARFFSLYAFIPLVCLLFSSLLCQFFNDVGTRFFIDEFQMFEEDQGFWWKNMSSRLFTLLCENVQWIKTPSFLAIFLREQVIH